MLTLAVGIAATAAVQSPLLSSAALCFMVFIAVITGVTTTVITMMDTATDTIRATATIHRDFIVRTTDADATDIAASAAITATTAATSGIAVGRLASDQKTKRRR